MPGSRFAERAVSLLASAAILSVFLVAPAQAQTVDAAAPRVFVASFGLSDAQRVFRYEAEQAARVLSTYYGRSGESVVLPSRQQPKIPRPAAIRAALTDITGRMDKERDVLILFMTSHGTEQGIAWMEGRRVTFLPPGWLGALLGETGVSNKVLIVSACHSGVFVPLANPHTLVITAAHAKNSSFGCDDTRKMTYFGDSLINKGVPAAATLPDAFAAARAIVGRLELRDCGRGRAAPAQYRKAVEQGTCAPPSDPQMAGGEAFARELRAVPVDATTKRQLRLDVF
jgi:hypothetical protein